MSRLQALIFKNYCTYCFSIFMSYSFLSNYCNRDNFLHYKTRANVYVVLGRGVVGSCIGVYYCSYLGGGGFTPGLNPRTRVPVASMLTTRPPKLSGIDSIGVSTSVRP
jgi:hypothetical protein